MADKNTFINPVIYENKIKSRMVDLDYADTPLLRLVEPLKNTDFKIVGGDKITIIGRKILNKAKLGEIGGKIGLQDLTQVTRELLVKELQDGFSVNDKDKTTGFYSQETINESVGDFGYTFNLAKNEKITEVLSKTKKVTTINKVNNEEISTKIIPSIGVGKGKYLVVNEVNYSKILTDKEFIAPGNSEQKTGTVGMIAGLNIIIDPSLPDNTIYATIDKPVLEATKSPVKFENYRNYEERYDVYTATQVVGYILLHDEKACVKATIEPSKA